jgi:Trk K+ transport system NAD-binding subunit
MAVGNVEQLSSIRDLTLGTRREGSQLILGYGDVGRQVATVLSDCGTTPTILDTRDLSETGFPHIIGNATAEADLLQAGIKDAVGVLIMLNQDSDAIYATLLAKNLNPQAFVVVRANSLRSAENIYRAGADYVASLPIAASHMLARIVQGDEGELDLLYEDLELKIFHVRKRSRMTGRTLAELDLPERFSCRVVAMERIGQATALPDKKTVIESGDILALIGSPKDIEAFSRKYDQINRLEIIMNNLTQKDNAT